MLREEVTLECGKVLPALIRDKSVRCARVAADVIDQAAGFRTGEFNDASLSDGGGHVVTPTRPAQLLEAARDHRIPVG